MERFDLHGDVSHEQISKFSKWYDFPQYVKQASVDQLLDLPEKPSAFADPIHKHFNCATKAATYLSCVFFAENASSMNSVDRKYVGENLKKFASKWGITPDCDAVFARQVELRQNTDANLPDSAFAIVKASEDGQLVRQYPLRNAREVKAAAEWFVENLPGLRNEFQYSDRRLFAQKILTKASEFGADVNAQQETLERHAGYGTGPSDKIAQMLENRARLASGRISDDEVVAMRVLADATRKLAAHQMDHDTRGHLVSTVDSCDRQLGLLNKYTDGVPAPEDVIYAYTESKISAIRDNTFETTIGSVYTLDQAKKLSKDLVRDVFGADFADDVSTGLRVDAAKLATIAATLPRNDAHTFDDMMREAGEKPVKLAHVALGISSDIFSKLEPVSLETEEELLPTGLR